MRATRDLLRRRIFIVRKRAEFLSHIQNTNHQYNLDDINKRISYKANRVCLDDHFPDPIVQKNVDTDINIIAALEEQIRSVESIIVKCARYHDPIAYTLLQTIPGIGRILALTILYEIENIERFPKVQNFVSYCRLVKCPRESSGKKTASKNNKIGNANLRWAFSEAACLFIRDNDYSKQYHQNLVNRYGKAKALAIIAHKLGRAVYFILKRRCGFSYNIFYAGKLSGIHEPSV